MIEKKPDYFEPVRLHKEPIVGKNAKEDPITIMMKVLANISRM